jgi:hypothetical protein
MSRPITGAALLVALGLAGCGDGPSEPARAVPGPDNRPLELAGFTAALADVRTRILPALGDGSTVESLAQTLGDLERALPGADGGRIEAALARANASAMQLRTDTAFLPDLDVVLLVLDQIAATVRGPALPVAGNANQPLPPRREQ